MNKYIKFPLVLGSVALASGTLLATTYQLTKDAIAQGIIDRQTSAINDLFETIDSKELLEIPTDFASKGVNSIVKVKSEGKDYYCYTIEFKDSVGGDKGSVIVALTSDAKVYGVKFVSTGDAYMAKYNDETYLASVVTNDGFDAISGASLTGNDLNMVLKIAKDCLLGNAKTPLDELFDGNVLSKTDVNKPNGASNKINSIQKVVSNNKNYYVYDVSYNDAYGDAIHILYALNSDGSFYRVKVISGDAYALKFDLTYDLDTVSKASASREEIRTHYNMVKEVHTDVLINEMFTSNITDREAIFLASE